jgi:hypothetical protein
MNFQFIFNFWFILSYKYSFLSRESLIIKQQKQVYNIFINQDDGDSNLNILI